MSRHSRENNKRSSCSWIHASSVSRVDMFKFWSINSQQWHHDTSAQCFISISDHVPVKFHDCIPATVGKAPPASGPPPSCLERHHLHSDVSHTPVPGLRLARVASINTHTRTQILNTWQIPKTTSVVDSPSMGVSRTTHTRSVNYNELPLSEFRASVHPSCLSLSLQQVAVLLFLRWRNSLCEICGLSWV